MAATASLIQLPVLALQGSRFERVLEWLNGVMTCGEILGMNNWQKPYLEFKPVPDIGFHIGCISGIASEFPPNRPSSSPWGNGRLCNDPE